MRVKISRRDDRIRLLFAVNEPFHCDDVDSVAQCALGRKFWKILNIVVDYDDNKRVAV